MGVAFLQTVKRWVKVLLLCSAFLSMGSFNGTITFIYQTSDEVLIREITFDRQYQFLFWLSGDLPNAAYFQGRGDHALQQLNELYARLGWEPVEL